MKPDDEMIDLRELPFQPEDGVTFGKDGTLIAINDRGKKKLKEVKETDWYKKNYKKNNHSVPF